MKIRYGSKYISQIFLEGEGWRPIAPIRLRDIDKPIRSEIAKRITRVHIISLGDYTIAELQRSRKAWRERRERQ